MRKTPSSAPTGRDQGQRRRAGGSAAHSNGGTPSGSPRSDDLRALRLRRTLVERVDQGVVTIDSDLKVESANDAAERLLGGLSEGAVLPDPWPDFPLRSFSAALFGPDPNVVRVRVSPDDDRYYTLDGIPAGKAFRTALLVITDVSELELRERIEREFVANAAHELRTPVAAISGAVEVLQQGAKERADERDHFISIIDRQAHRLARHVLLAGLGTRQHEQRAGEYAELRSSSVRCSRRSPSR